MDGGLGFNTVENVVLIGAGNPCRCCTGHRGTLQVSVPGNPEGLKQSPGGDTAAHSYTLATLQGTVQYSTVQYRGWSDLSPYLHQAPSYQ